MLASPTMSMKDLDSPLTYPNLMRITSGVPLASWACRNARYLGRNTSGIPTPKFPSGSWARVPGTLTSTSAYRRIAAAAMADLKYREVILVSRADHLSCVHAAHCSRPDQEPPRDDARR